ncbi:MAG: PLP-dependent lyase/thiolase [Candidatus Muiribacterium halophilum]|uniref:PLP-dependent lyase/thiolase n=1 Tax=Muiribacterium halophilum TaxID=2053465 RepID=A0A2N5ZF55_MUIH1|nr:MAG: PLP-dependent lyase/thiolase [Candidatus Muirbacterium halophilum]
MSRKNEIMKKAMGLDYSDFQINDMAFDYEKMMTKAGLPIDEIRKIQLSNKVGNTPLFELKNITRLVRKTSEKGKGARIFLKDEAANASGSFKARRASVSAYMAKKHGYKGIVAATSGNYGAAVASQAAIYNLGCIILQEVFDSRFKGQPEIIEKTRKCEAYGAEVIQLSVGPELFYCLLDVLEDTGYFNASLYTPFGIAGVETLGYELSMQCKDITGKFPENVVITHAGGGNLTGTARGIKKAGGNSKVIGASVDLHGLHMASDNDFNKKSFTTGHTGFGIPFATWPDRVDVPKNAARPLRYMEKYLTVSQVEVFFTTELLSQVEGMERGPAGNTSLAAAIALSRELPEDEIIVVQETEYTSAGKHPSAQLTFAKENGIDVKVGDPRDNVPGKNIIIPENISQLGYKEIPIDKLRKTYLKNIKKNYGYIDTKTKENVDFLTAELNINADRLAQLIQEVF